MFLTLLLVNIALTAMVFAYNDYKREYEQTPALTLALITVVWGALLALPILVVQSWKEAFSKRG